MKHHKYIAIPTFIIFTTLFLFPDREVWAITMPTVPFGGRVLFTKIPTVVCPEAAALGTAPVVLSSNLSGVVQTVSGSIPSNQNTGQRLGNVVGGLYKAIPLYTIRISSVTGKPLTQPKPGDWILGRHELIPSLSSCNTTLLGGVPFPVKKTDNYGVSKKNGGE